MDNIGLKFMDGNDLGVFYPDTPTEVWCDLYTLEITEDRCPECNRLRIADLPVFWKGFRGLISNEHACGPNHRLLVLRAWGSQTYDWRDVLA